MKIEPGTRVKGMVVMPGHRIEPKTGEDAFVRRNSRAAVLGAILETKPEMARHSHMLPQPEEAVLNR
jgi:hypothetical protein